MSLLDTTGNCNVGSMGLSHGLQLDTLNPKIKRRWLFSIPGIVLGSAPALPPKRAARPGIQMKEYEFQHIHESVWFPLKGEWKTINLTLYDIRCKRNIVFDWLLRIYTPNSEELKFNPALQPIRGNSSFKVPLCKLELYDGCGEILECWNFENVYPSDINWGELDMESNDLVLVDLTLRYDRAYMCLDTTLNNNPQVPTNYPVEKAGFNLNPNITNTPNPKELGSFQTPSQNDFMKFSNNNNNNANFQSN